MSSRLFQGRLETESEIRGVEVDAGITIEALLERDDAERCFAEGVTLTRGEKVIGWLSPSALSELLRRDMARLRRERDTARQGLIAAGERQRTMLANIGHELRTPINAITGYSELLATGLAEHRFGRHAEALWEATQALTGTVDAMLDVAQMETGHAELHETPIDVPCLIDTAARMLRTSVEDRRVRLRNVSASDLPPLIGDHRMIRQILVNLMVNAVKYGGTDGEIRIGARIDMRGRMVIEVADDGPGMCAEAIEAAMQPLRALSESGRATGTGLGLPLVKGFTELHEGTFRLLSTPGKGTRALVVLPRERVSSPDVPALSNFAFHRRPDPVRAAVEA